MSDDTPTQRYPAGGEPVPPPGGNPPPPPGADSPTAPLPDDPSAVPVDSPTEVFTPPPPPPGTPGTGAGDEPPEKKSKALLITLISIGGALLLALILLLFYLFWGEQPGPEPSSDSPTPTATPSPTPTETPTEEPSEEPEPPAPGAIEDFDASDNNVDCSGGGPVPVEFSWEASGTHLWFGIGTNDAHEEPYAEFDLVDTQTIDYQCGQPDAQQLYTITVEGEDGEFTSRSIIVRETA